MPIDKIGSTANMTIAVEVQTAVKKQEKHYQETSRGDVVSIGKSEAINATQVRWPPLFPIGHTQGIYTIDE
jgi:hypothetical protein